MIRMVFSAALIAAFAHLYATVRDNPAAHYLNHVGILNGTVEDPVVYRVLLPALVDAIARLLPMDYAVTVVALHLLVGAVAVMVWLIGCYRLMCVWLPEVWALVGCLWLALIYTSLTTTIPGLIAYTPVEACFVVWGLVWLFSRVLQLRRVSTVRQA